MSQQPESDFPILTFNVGGDVYALPVDDVLEVAAMVELTPITDAPPEVLGIVNRHGEIVPLLDLRRVFKLEPSPVTAATLFIVARQGNQYLGLVVDDVYQVEYVSSAHTAQASITGKYIRAMMNHKSRLISIISLQAVWASFRAGELAEDKG